MKKKNTMPERDWQQTHEKIRRRELRKRILVMGLTVAMVANTVDLSALSVSAKTDESETGKTTIVSFEELSKDITEQTLPIGALESDIKFPTSLTVTVEKTTQADEKEADDEEDASETGDTEKDDAQKDDSNGDTASSDDKKDTESSDEKDGDSGNADASETGDTEKDDAQKDDSNGDTASSDDKKDTESSDEKDGDSGNADASETGDTEKDDAQKDDSNGDTASSDDKKDTESSDEKDGDSGNADASDKSGASDNGNADTKDSDTSKDSGNSDKSNNPNGSRSSDTEDTQARADLPSAFGAFIGQMADALLPHKLIVYAAEKDDASDTAATSDGADNAKKTDTASTSDNADSVKTTDSSDAAASSETETTTEKIRLENIKWELNVEESDAEEFDSSEASNGFCYAYTPVLPDEDGDGNQLVLGKDVELPTIYVLVGEYGIALLADGTIEVTETNADGTKKAPYTAQDLATWIGEHGSANLQKVSIKLLNNDTSITKELTIDTGLAKEIELDLDGHTLTLAGGARLYFKKVSITITSSGSNKGTITGSYDCINKLKGEGLVTADRDSMLTIKHVTIENAGTGPTVAMWGGVTCTIDNASISGSSGDQVGIITIVKGKACTITNTKVTGNVWSDYGTIMFTDSCSDCTIGNGAVIENKNSGGRCVAFGSYVKKGSVKITIKKGATLTANDGNGIIMNTSYGTVAVNIEGGTFNGRLRLPDNSQIAGGTFAPASDNAIWVNNSKKTLQDLLKVGYTLQYDDDGTYADLTARWTDEGRKVMAVKSPLYFMTHPTISSGAETVMENYTAAEAPELTVKAVSGSGSISYQWYADETINGTTTKVEQTGQGAKTATYRIPTGLSAGTYQYYCVATCGNDTATSKKAAFTVEEGVAEVTVGGNTTRYATLTKAIAAIKDTVAADDADLEITLKILKNISESGSEWKIDGNTKKVSFRMDLNGCTVIGNGLYITGEGVEAVFKDTSTGQNGTLNAPISIQSKAKLTVENGNYKGVLRFVDGATAKLKDGYYSSSIYIGKTERMDNTDISCTITGGTYVGTEVLVCGGATLSVSGDTAKIKALHIDHREFIQIKRAKVMLSGGEYGEIALSNSGEVDDESLLNEMLGYAIADTLEEGYAFYSAGIKTDISRTDRSQGSVEVLRADTLEDTSQAVVKFQIEKNSGETKTMYFLTWDAAMFYLEGSEEHRKNKEYKLWEKLEILLLKDTTADKSINRMLNKVYLPAEITLRSEGNKPHTLKRSNENYLFITGGQDVIIENINVVGNIDFLGDTRGTQAQDAAVLRLGERATGLENIEVTGNAEIVIEKGAEIPKTFTGDGGNLNVSIYCNHDSADFSSKITQGAGAFKIWFPIELGGIALPTGGENDTNVTQRDGVTYGLYSNGGTTDQKIKVTGEVCSYEPYGGNAVTIKTTDLSFTMPSSKVTLKAHTKDDYGYCSNCKRTDLAEAYKKSRLIIEGLEGRIYDGYPQVMTGITLMTANGDVKLTGPEYKSGKELAQDSTNSANADITKADYTVVYENNIKCNENEESTDAPTAIITGRGAYYGTVEVKFAIKKGEMQVTGATAAATEYDGTAHTALAGSDAISVTLKADKYDANAHIPVTDGYIAPCVGKTLATDGFDSEYMDTFPLQITCKGADGKAYGDANTYTVTNAGSYPFTIKVMAENNSCPSVVIPLTAEIAPRPITIKVENMHRTYGEIFPGMEKLKFKIVSGTLAAGDTEAEFWKELDFWTDAEATKPDGDAGKWAFGIKEASTSGNYSIKVEGYYEDINHDDSAAVTRENGFLYTDRAQGEFVKLAGYKDNWSVSYGDAPFSLAVETNNIHDNLPEYTVTDAKDANGNDIDQADIATRLLSVSREGEVTIKGAGSATIKLLYPTAINYTEAEPLTVEVNITRAYWNPPNIHRDFLSLRGGSDSIDLAALLPKDCGGVTYGVVKTSDSKSILEGVSVSQDGRLSYTVKTDGAVGDEATITVPVSTANYNTNQGILVVIKLIDQLPVQLKGGISLKKAALTYGEALSSLQFNSATFADKVSGKTVPGKLSFDEPDKKPDAGDYNAAWTFTPTDDAYAKCKGMITVSVKKAVPKVVSVPIPEAYYYSPTGIAADWCQSHAQKSGEVRGADGAMLDGIWRFKEASLVPKPGTNAYPVIFTPTDTKNYETMEKTVTLTVKKAMPYISTQPATANAYTHGDYLYNQTLAGAAIYGNGMGSTGTGTGAAASVAGTFKWKAPSTKLTYLGNKTFEYLFTPEDTASYEAVTGSVTVMVNQAQDAPFMPGSKMNVAHSCETVGSVKLPQGWKWDDADAAKALVEDDGTGGNVTSATAVYDGADKGSYKAETVTIQITRASCEHAKKEVKGAVKATCIAEGTTGETWCLVCGKKLDDGVATPKDTANHTNLVSRQLRPATTTQEGIMSYACSGCGYYAEKAIEKLVSGGSSNTGSSNGSGSSSGHHSGSTGSNSGRKDSTAAQSANQAPAPTPAPAPMPVPAPAPAQPANPIRSQGNAAAEQGEQAMPFIRGEDGKEGWEVIKAETAARAEGERVTVDMNGASVVPGDVFDEIRGKNVTIEFDLGGGISWSVNGKSVSDKVGDIDFRVTYGEGASDAIPVDLINALTGERTSMNVTLAYEGRFGFEAVLRINVGAANQGLVANLFYYNESTRELEFISAGEVDAEGFAYLSFTHASDYTIVLDEASMEEAALTDTTGAAGSDGAESAETASEDSVKDNSDTESRAALIWLIAFAGIAAAAAIGAVAVKKRKEEKQTK